MLVTSKELLLKAQEGGYAVGAFNVENMEMVMAVVEAAEELKKYTEKEYIETVWGCGYKWTSKK